MEELWKDVVGYEGLYQVSNLGRVKSLHFRIGHEIRILDKHIRKNTGYEVVLLVKDSKKKQHKVHRLVAEAFLPNPCDYPQINHKDKNRANNNVDNLEWCSPQYNVDYSCSKEIDQFTKEGTFVRRWKSSKELERAGFNRSVVWRCMNNCPKYKSHRGFLWRYAS